MKEYKVLRNFLEFLVLEMESVFNIVVIFFEIILVRLRSLIMEFVVEVRWFSLIVLFISIVRVLNIFKVDFSI